MNKYKVTFSCIIECEATVQASNDVDAIKIVRVLHENDEAEIKDAYTTDYVATLMTGEESNDG